jgi:hypothetical protein
MERRVIIEIVGPVLVLGAVVAAWLLAAGGAL